MTDKTIFGRRGETLAKKYLESSGYQIIALNYRCGRREIDLIAKQKEDLVFMEIKTRVQIAASRWENPLGRRQTETLRRALLDYCARNYLRHEKVRLDLIIILVNTETKKADLRHYQNIL